MSNFVFSILVQAYDFSIKYISRENFSTALGNLSSICFFLVYIPQYILNWSRQSVEGFSLSSITLKLVGSAFLCINSLYNGSGFPLFLYGFLNTIEHCLFLFQFFRYGKVFYAPLLALIVVVPYLICIFFPKLIPITDLVKPVTQFISHIPQLISCITRKTTLNVSIYSQHLHFIGSFLGCVMLILEENYNITNWVLYGNTFIQAFSIYFLAAWYGELRFKESSAENRSVSRKIFNDSFKSI